LISDYSLLVAKSFREKVGGAFMDMIMLMGVTPNMVAQLLGNIHNQHEM